MQSLMILPRQRSHNLSRLKQKEKIQHNNTKNSIILMIQIYLLLHYLSQVIAKELNWCLIQNDDCLPIEKIKHIYQYDQITFTSIIDLEKNQTILFQGLTNEFQIIIDNSTDFNFTQTMNGLQFIHNITINISIVHQITIGPGMDFRNLLFQLINKLNKSIKIQDKKIKIVDCHIKAKKIDNEITILDVKFEYSEFIEYNIRLKLKFKGIIIYFQDFEPQKKFIYQTEIAVENPQFWWPIRYGEQNLYDLEIYHQLETGWELVYSHQYGIRSITFSYEYGIRINKIEIITKEVRVDVQKSYHHLTNGMIIQNAISLGFNLIRIQEQFVDKELFELADQHGIMVILIIWDEQDITINNQGQQLINTIIRFKNHCSLVSYGGILEWQLGNSKQSYQHNDIALNKISQYIDQYNSQWSYIILYNPPVNLEQDAYDYTSSKVHNQQYKLNQDHLDNLKSSFKLTYNKFDQAYYLNCVQYEYYSNLMWINKLHNISQQQTSPSLNNVIDQNNSKLAGAYAIKNNQQTISIGYKFEKNLLIIQIIQEFFIISNVTLSTQLRFFVNNTIWHKQNNSLFINRYIISDVQIVKINKEQLKHSQIFYFRQAKLTKITKIENTDRFLRKQIKVSI
ncbi:hypothetical protein pb186bvf_001631 [Paramecium bursaria]